MTGIMKKLYLILGRKSLMTIYKSFIRPNLGYADIINNKPLNESLKMAWVVRIKFFFKAWFYNNLIIIIK